MPVPLRKARTGAIAPKPQNTEDCHQGGTAGREGESGGQNSRGADGQEEGTTRRGNIGSHTHVSHETGNTENDDREREERWMQPYGARRGTKDDEHNLVARVITHNINSFPQLGALKFMRMRQEYQHNDVIGISELNRNWRKIPAQESYRNRTNHWWKCSKTQVTWLNDPEWPSTFQQGGVALTVQGPLTPFCQDKGSDSTGLGRWAWITLEGRSEKKTVIIQIYRPCKNEKDNGSTFNQQKAWTDNPDPRKAFDDDLLDTIDEFRTAKFQIILMGDFNMAMGGPETPLERQLKQRGIIDHIQARYGRANAPNTQKRGSKPIDAIMASETLEMIQGGYDEGMDELSDHRIIWAEFSLDSMLGIDRGVFQKPKTRKLQTQNKRITKNFIKKLEEQILKHKLLVKAEKLKQDIGQSRCMTQSQKHTYETIDKQRGRAVQYASQHCTKLPSDQCDFSPKLRHAIGRAIIWKEILKKKQNHRKIHKKWIQNMKARWDIKEHINVTKDTEEVKQQVKLANEHLWEVKRNAPELRREFLDLLIQQAEDAGNDRKAKDIRAIRDRERLREVHQRIKFAQGRIKGGGVKFVESIEPDGTRTTIKDKDAMERAIRSANESKLHCANESNLRQGQIGEILTDGDYDTWEAFMQGHIQLPDTMDEGSRKWLETFQGKPTTDRELNITTESYAKSWRRPREHTACAPGPLHFGVFKAMHGSEIATKLHTIMATIPIQTGYTPTRWNQCVDSMLPKKEDEWRPEKLRLTALLMPDFNHNNKILGRATMAWAEEDNILAIEQYGSRKNLSAAKHALNKRLMLDIMRIQKKPGVVCANDAKACYDRILHLAAYLSLRKTGLAKEATRSMLHPISKMKHSIRTAYGDSKLTYGGDEWTRPPSGICQGNGAGPAIWVLVSSPLLQMLRESGYGAKFKSAMGQVDLHMAGAAFVDDADLVQTGELEDATEDVLAKAQEQIYLWEQGIRATGGGIEGTKSDFAIINFHWNEEGQWTYETKQDRHKIRIPNNKGGQDELTQLAHNEARRTLGVWQAVDGNEEEQTKQMKGKARKWSQGVKCSSLSREDVALGIKTSLYPSLTYGLVATALTENQGREVFKPIRDGALSALGYNKHLPWQIVHGPAKYGGIGIQDIYTVQGIEHVKILLDEAHTDSPTGKLLTILQHDHVLEIGRDGFLLNQPYAAVQHLMTDTWYKNTLQFISNSDIQIQGDQEPLHRWREEDTLLMDDFTDTPGHTFSHAEMAAANRCRMYLQATTRSDISHGNGQRILQGAWHVLREWTSTSARAYNWPRQPRPPMKDRRIWQKFLSAAYGVDAHHLGWARRVKKWNACARPWIQWWYDRTNDHLYEQRHGQWTRWTKALHRTRIQDYIPAERGHTEPPPSAHPAVTTRHTVIYMEGFDRHTNFLHNGNTRDDGTTLEPEASDTIGRRSSNDISTAHARSAEDLKHTLTKYHKSLHWVMEKLRLPRDQGATLAQQIQEGTLELICDGSLKDGLGTSAATVKGGRPDTRYTIVNRVPGEGGDQSSYRSELCGILAHVLLVNGIARHHGITEGEVTIGCDNEKALWTAFGKHQANTGDASHDILRVIHANLKKSNIKWTYRHVYGHQDRKKHADQLDDWELANVEADKFATDYWHHVYSDNTERLTTERMPGEGWRVVIQGTHVLNNVERRIYEHKYRPACLAYWEKKGRINEGQGQHVDWEIYRETTKITPRSKTQWTHKHFCGFEATNYMLHKFGERQSPQCPQCDAIEKHSHIMQCTADAPTKQFETIFTAHSQWLINTTSPGIADAMIEQIMAYRENRPVQVKQIWSDNIREAVQAQTRLGDRAFIEGCITSTWEELQTRYHEIIKIRRSARRWTKEMIQKTWMISWDMWDARNGIVHNNQLTRQTQIIAILQEQITNIHNSAQENRFLTRAARTFFHQPVENIFKLSEYQQRTWKRIGERYLENDRKRAARNRSAALMRGWLMTAPRREGRRSTRISPTTEERDEGEDTRSEEREERRRVQED